MLPASKDSKRRTKSWTKVLIIPMRSDITCISVANISRQVMMVIWANFVVGLSTTSIEAHGASGAAGPLYMPSALPGPHRPPW